MSQVYLDLTNKQTNAFFTFYFLFIKYFLKRPIYNTTSFAKINDNSNIKKVLKDSEIIEKNIFFIIMKYKLKYLL